MLALIAAGVVGAALGITLSLAGLDAAIVPIGLVVGACIGRAVGLASIKSERASERSQLLDQYERSQLLDQYEQFEARYGPEHPRAKNLRAFLVRMLELGGFHREALELRLRGSPGYSWQRGDCCHRGGLS